MPFVDRTAPQCIGVLAHKTLEAQVVVHGDRDLLLRPEVALGRLDGGVTEQELDLLQIAAVLRQSLAQVRRRSWAPKRSIPVSLADSVTTDQTAQSLKLFPYDLATLQDWPEDIPFLEAGGRGQGVDRLLDAPAVALLKEHLHSACPLCTITIAGSLSAWVCRWQ
jgi:hypothetical protein